MLQNKGVLDVHSSKDAKRSIGLSQTIFLVFILIKWSTIIRMSVVLRRTVWDDIDWHFDNLSGSHLQSQVICVTSVDTIRTPVVFILLQTFHNNSFFGKKRQLRLEVL